MLQNETIDRALSGLVFWRSGVNNGKQFLCASEWSTYLVCYRSSLIYKAPRLGVFQPFGIDENLFDVVQEWND